MKSLKLMGKTFEKVTEDAIHSSLDEHVAQMEVYLHKLDQASLYSRIKVFDLRGSGPGLLGE